MTGENEVFEGKYDVDPIMEGSHYGVSYKIYLHEKITRKGELARTHYLAYICLGDITDDVNQIHIKGLPPVPVHGGITYGPSKDGWIGFGTLDRRNYNFDTVGNPLEQDRRMDPEDIIFETGPLLEITPPILHQSTLKWIEDICDHVQEHSKQTIRDIPWI